MPAFPLLENFPMRNLHTFHFDVKARYFCEISELSALQELLGSGIFRDKPSLFLGGGSNIIFKQDFEGLVIHIVNKGIETIERKPQSVIVKAAAGENWHQFVNWCVENGFGGLENLSLIPGNVGSCPIQNIGAYGVEIKDCFHSLQAIDLQAGELVTFNKNDCRFGYRDSIFKHELKGKFIIWSVSFELMLKPVLNISYGAIGQELKLMGVENPSIADVSNAVCRIRQSKLPDPEVLGNAGSFFKNPVVNAEKAESLRVVFPKMPSYLQHDGTVKLASGWLIEQCGWKGYRRGDAGVHATQALVLVNYGNATGVEIMDLANEIKHSVNERFGVELEMEVNVV